MFCERYGDTICGTEAGVGKCFDTFVPPDGFDCYCKHESGGKYCNLTQVCVISTSLFNCLVVSLPF